MNTLNPEDQEFAELQARRQELEQGIKEARGNAPSSWENILSGLLQGTRSGMAEQGLSTVQGDPELSEFKNLLHTQEELGHFADQHDRMVEEARQYLHQEHQDMEDASPEERMAFKTGNWMGGGLATPVSSGSFKGVQGGAELLKKLMGYLGRDAAIGAGSATLQEEGVNPFVADILTSLVGRNAQLPSAERGAEKEVRKMISNAAQKNLKSGEKPFSVNAVLETLRKRMNDEKAGELLRKALLEKIQGYDEAAKDAIYQNHPPLNKDLYVRDRIERGGGLEKVWGETESTADSVRADRALGKVIEKGQDSRSFALGNAEIPEMFLNKSLESVENARQLMKVVGSHPQAKKALEGYVQHHVLSHVMDEAGKVDVKKLTEWKKSYPSYGVLSPKLEKKLNNLMTAQMFANNVLHQAKDLPLMEIPSHVPQQALDGFLGALKGTKGIPSFAVTLLTHHYQDLKNRKTVGLLQDALGDQDLLTLFSLKPNQLWSTGELLKRISGRDVARSVQAQPPSLEAILGQRGQYFTASQEP